MGGAPWGCARSQRYGSYAHVTDNLKSVAVAMAMAGSDFFEFESGSSSSSDDESKVISRRLQGKKVYLTAYLRQYIIERHTDDLMSVYNDVKGQRY